jgi:YidC/Oxa1 family membrane protein insertase
MDNQRLLVWAAFGLLLWFTWQAWMQDYGQKPAPDVQTRPVSDISIPDEALGSLPEMADSAIDGAELETEAPPDVETAAADIIHVRTDVFDLEISRQGGTIRRATIRKYPVAKDRPNELVELLSPEQSNFGLLQTGIRVKGDGAEPNHLATFTSARSDYDLGDAGELELTLDWSDGQGVTVRKTFRFRRGSYRIDVSQTVSNGSASDWQGADYAQIRRRSHEPERSMFDVDTYSFDGPVFFNGEKSEKLQRDDLLSDGPVQQKATDGWMAVIQHHFLIAVEPAAGVAYTYNIAVQNKTAVSSAIGSAVTVAPGAKQPFESTLFIGPKLQDQLEEISPKLKLTVDYGWLTTLSQPLFWLLSKVHDFVKNWGLSIILVTVLIKLVFYKLTAASGRSMAKMREIQPRMKALQERYKDDRQQLSQAMMELYKREKVNPAAGCLPILIQMPFFLAFYWVLLESVEMRQAPFALWITDLSSRDPYFILPLIMGVAMFFQQKLNPAPADPVQAKVMQIMPVVFTGFFAFFPSGLVLYWVTNTLLSIAQQWRINKLVHAEALASKGMKKKKNKKDD